MSAALAGLTLVFCVVSVSRAAGAAPSNPNKKLVCWTDASGQRACGDSVPPQYSSKEKQVIDPQGRIVRTLPAALTPEQRAAQEKAAADAARAKDLATQQAANDRALLMSYSRPEEIVEIRNDRLSSLDTSARLTQKAIERDQGALADLEKRLPADGTPNKDKKLADQITRMKTSLADNLKALANIQRNRDAVCESFDHDVRRFQEMKSGEVNFESPCPRPDLTVPGDEGHVDLAAVKSAFEGFAALAKSRREEMFDLYADDAVIRYPYVSASGSKETAELSRDEYRTEVLEEWKKLKDGTPGPAFTDLSYTPDKGGGAKVSGHLVGGAGKPGPSFYMVMRPAGVGQWRIVEQWSDDRF